MRSAILLDKREDIEAIQGFRGEFRLKEQLDKIRERIRRSAEACGRDPEEVHLVTVSKTQTAARVRAALDAGATILGENYVQESRDKIRSLKSYPASWHFIGHLQKNKAKLAVGLFDLIHSLDSLELATELDKQAARIGKIQRILLQVNIGNEPSKSGIPVSKALQLTKDISRLKNLAVEGLMAMPPFFNAPERARPYFSAVRQLRDKIQDEQISGISMDVLSMGMTGDFEVAIEEGATLVRIGTAIFGERK
jgi:pyridoxal phosphate enzyme (YggS family)